jgi:hypothetical protein
MKQFTQPSILLGLVIILFHMQSNAQVGIGTSTPHQSAMLEVSNISKGVLIPRMTAAQRTSISLPANGLLVYQTDDPQGLYYNAGTPGLPNWTSMQSAATAAWTIDGNNIYNSNSGKVGIGTTSPASRLSVGNNSQFQIDDTGNIRKINNVPYSFPTVQAQPGQSLKNDGFGMLTWASGGEVFTLTSANSLTAVIADNNFIRIEGTITLTANYNKLNRENLVITGGTIVGNGTFELDLQTTVICNGVRFQDINLDCLEGTFINCYFSGNCPNLGTRCKFINCKFNGVTTTNARQFGTLQHCDLNTCTIAEVDEIINSEVSNSTLADVKFVNNCQFNDCTISAGSNFIFSNNYCEDTKIVVGNAGSFPSRAMISNNHFDDLLAGATEAILINPGESSTLKTFNIQNNTFQLGSSDPQAVRISGNDASSFGYSRINIQGNNFYRSTKTLDYSSNIKVLYSQNVTTIAAHPTSSGNLTVVNNY